MSPNPHEQSKKDPWVPPSRPRLIVRRTTISSQCDWKDQHKLNSISQTYNTYPTSNQHDISNLEIQRTLLDKPRQERLFNNLVLDYDWKRLYEEDTTDNCDEGYVHIKSQCVKLMTKGVISSSVDISKCKFHNSGNDDFTNNSSIIKKLGKDMIMITSFDIFIGALVTKSNFREYMRTCNLIRVLISTLDPTFSINTYRTIHDEI